jgi:hypothetical protein
MLVASTASAGGVTILPSGDMSGATDQSAIQAAFDAAASDKNAKIRLGVGTFYLNGGVKATGFQGSLRGSGKTETEVIALGEGDRANNRGSVFLFEGGNPKVSNLTINVPDGSRYLDSSPFLGTSDGGAAIHIFGGSATIKNVHIKSNGPFLGFGEESLETGILVQNGAGTFTLKSSTFEGNKRAFIFNPEEASQLDLNLKGNDFTNNRGGIFLLDFGGGNDGAATVSDNTFNDNFVGDVFGAEVAYPVIVRNNTIRHSVVVDGEPVGNSAIDFDKSGPLTITGNEIDGQYFWANIYVTRHTGGAVIADNTVRGASWEGNGAIGVEACDGAVIKNNHLIPDESLQVPSALGLSIVDCSSSQILDNRIELSAGVVSPVHILLDEATRNSVVVGRGNETVVDATEIDEDVIVNDRIFDFYANPGQQLFELSATPSTGEFDFIAIQSSSGFLFLFPGDYTFSPNSNPQTVTLNTPLAEDEQLFIQYESTDVIYYYSGCGAASGVGIGFDRSDANTETVVVTYSSPFAGAIEVEVLLQCVEVNKNNTISSVFEIIG